MSSEHRRMGGNMGVDHYQVLLNQNIDRNTIECANRVTPIDLDLIEDEDTKEFYRELLILHMEWNTHSAIREHYEKLHRELDRKVEQEKAKIAESVDAFISDTVEAEEEEEAEATVNHVSKKCKKASVLDAENADLIM